MTTRNQSEDGDGEEEGNTNAVGTTTGEGEEDNEDKGAEYFIVEKILGEKQVDGKLHYKVRWLGYGPKDDTLEPVEGLAHCVEIIAAWEAKKAQKQQGI
jgi:DNA (cytosine-5)-methyltransferase 1